MLYCPTNSESIERALARIFVPSGRPGEAEAARYANGAITYGDDGLRIFADVMDPGGKVFSLDSGFLAPEGLVRSVQLVFQRYELRGQDGAAESSPIYSGDDFVAFVQDSPRISFLAGKAAANGKKLGILFAPESPGTRTALLDVLRKYDPQESEETGDFEADVLRLLARAQRL